VGHPHVTPGREPGTELAAPRLAAGLPTVLRRALGEPVRVRSLARLKGGYSREMWSFDALLPHGSRGLILCADMAGGVVDHADALSRVGEYRLLAELRARGVPVPAVLCAGGADDVLGRPYLVMERMEGITAVGPLLRDPHYVRRHDQFGRQKAEILAMIHARAAPADLFTGTGSAGAGDVVGGREAARWARAVSKVPDARTPAVRAAVRWLERHQPARQDRVALVHGDYRTGNLLYGPDGIRAVLDWEMAHPGDPLEDVAFAQLVCWRVETGRVGGLVTADRWIELYSRAARVTVDRDSLHFWEVLGTVKMAALTLRAGQRLPPGRERGLLTRLFAQLDSDLGDRLLPGAGRSRDRRDPPRRPGAAVSTVNADRRADVAQLAAAISPRENPDGPFGSPDRRTP
jgi:aminoglycoside phosphotransferase (APT) family kinase protein